jgi:hAT family C-terminal dimerisation region
MPLSQRNVDLMRSDDEFSVHRFRIRHDKTFQGLREVALRILAMPASQRASERIFSAAENEQSSWSSLTLPSTLNDILDLPSKGKE